MSFTKFCDVKLKATNMGKKQKKNRKKIREQGRKILIERVRVRERQREREREIINLHFTKHVNLDLLI